MFKYLLAFMVALATAALSQGDAAALTKKPIGLEQANASPIVLAQANAQQKKKKRRKAQQNNRKRKAQQNARKRKAQKNRNAKRRKNANNRKKLNNRRNNNKAKRRAERKRNDINARKKRNKAKNRENARKKQLRRTQRAQANRKRRKVTITRNKKTVITPGRRKNITVHERRVVDRRGNVRVVRSRRVVVVDRRYRNRYYRGRSVFYSPPPGAVIAASAFAVSAAIVTAAVIHETFAAPPVVRVPRRYTVEEVVENPEVRRYVRSVDIDSVNFASGQADIEGNQLNKLDHIAGGIQRVLQDNPNAVFLVEGHTDAVGSADANLDLSEDRAFAVKVALMEEYGIPAKNLEVAGYGEQYLKVDTAGPSRKNRRVTIRNITQLIDRKA